MLKEIPAHKGYFVDETGKAVYSNKSGELKPLKIFMWGGRTRNYRTVLLVEKQIEKKKKIAALVLETFVSPRPEGNVIRHGIKGRLIDSLDNIKWGTPEENLQDQVVQNEILKGEQIGTCRLNELQVRIIRHAYIKPKKIINQNNNVGHISMIYLAKIFNVHVSAIKSIIRKTSWRHIP